MWLFGSTVFSHIISQTARFSGKCYWKSVCFDILCVLSETFLILRRNERDITIHLHRLSYKVTVIIVRFQWNLNFLDRISKKYSNIKFHENLFSGKRVVPCGRTDKRTDRRTNMTKLIVTLRNFANEPNNVHISLGLSVFENFHVTPCTFTQSTPQPTNALNKIQFMTRIKHLHVSAPGYRPQGFF
jgi:hypothetical protein